MKLWLVLPRHVLDMAARGLRNWDFPRRGAVHTREEMALERWKRDPERLMLIPIVLDNPGMCQTCEHRYNSTCRPNWECRKDCEKWNPEL